MENMQTQELISALADGQLQGETFARGVELAASDPQARQAWESYHLIGDVLRSGTLAVGSLPPDFAERLLRRLQQEQQLPPVPALAGSLPVVAVQSNAPAANDGSFRWKVIAGVASVAAVAVLGWTLAGGMPGRTDPGPQLAATGGATVFAPDERGVMIRDPHLDELLAAHRQLGGASALQMPAGFVRNATFDSSNR
jgi:sigma-E factor negative regulatory protein RseA